MKLLSVAYGFAGGYRTVFTLGELLERSGGEPCAPARPDLARDLPRAPFSLPPR